MRIVNFKNFKHVKTCFLYSDHTLPPVEYSYFSIKGMFMARVGGREIIYNHRREGTARVATYYTYKYARDYITALAYMEHFIIYTNKLQKVTCLISF